MAPIRLAVLGSGIFAQEAHMPALNALTDDFDVVALYSRSQANAKALAATASHPIETYSEIEPILARADVEAVDIILPIAVQPDVIDAALKAGKHVISEKPMAPDVATGRRLLGSAAQLTANTGKLWMVAENFRYEAAFYRAGEAIRRGDIGRPVQFTWNTYTALNPQNKYYHTLWRRDNSFPGGFLLDGGVHDVAAMRAIMGEVASVAAFVTQRRDDLPPADTLSATLRFENGAFGIWTKTFVAEAPWPTQAEVVGESGGLRVNTKKLEVTSAGKTTTETFAIFNVKAELADFARCIAQGSVTHSTPEQALQDVAVIEAMFTSAREGCAVTPERIVASSET